MYTREREREDDVHACFPDFVAEEADHVKSLFDMSFRFPPLCSLRRWRREKT